MTTRILACPRLEYTDQERAVLRLDELEEAWQALPPVYCIMLDDPKSERNRKLVIELNQFGLGGRAMLMMRKRDPTGHLRGSWESHRAAARIGLKRDLESIVVFEDDVYFERDRDVLLKGLRRSAELLRTMPDDWQLLYLGHMPFLVWPTVKPQCWSGLVAAIHAYVGSRSYMQWLDKHSFEYANTPLTLDLYQCGLMSTRSYLVSPPIVYQSGAEGTSQHLGAQMEVLNPPMMKTWTSLQFMLQILIGTLILAAIVAIVYMIVTAIRTQRCKEESATNVKRGKRV